MQAGTKITKALLADEALRADEAKDHATAGKDPIRSARNVAIVEEFKAAILETAGGSHRKRILLKPIKAELGARFFLNEENVSLLVREYVMFHRDLQDEAKEASRMGTAATTQETDVELTRTIKSRMHELEQSLRSRIRDLELRVQRLEDKEEASE